jgi:hypothetical protein
MHPAYPIGTDLRSILIAAGLPASVVDAQDLDAACLAACEQWEQDSRYTPFLQTSATNTARSYDPPNGKMMQLSRGLIALESVEADGVELVSGEDYRLRPLNAAADGRPYLAIEFLRRISAQPGGIEISGVWGYGTELSAVVWKALLASAALEVIGSIGLHSPVNGTVAAGTIKAKQDDGVRIEYTGAEGSASQRAALEMAIIGWKRTRVNALRNHIRPSL